MICPPCQEAADNHSTHAGCTDAIAVEHDTAKKATVVREVNRRYRSCDCQHKPSALVTDVALQGTGE